MTAERKPFPWRKAISLALFAALLLLLCWYLYQNRADMASLLSLSAADVLKLLGLAFAGLVMNCVYHKLILDTYHVPMTLCDWMGAVCVSNMIAYVLPMRGDLVFLGAYYKRSMGLRYTRSLSMLGGNIVFGVGFALGQMGVSLVLTGLWQGRWPLILWLCWGLGALALAALIVAARMLEKRPIGALKRFKLLRDVAGGFNALTRDRSLLWRVVCCLAVSNAVKVLFYMAGFSAIGVGVTFYQAMFYSGVSWLASIFSIVPGNLGIKEGLMGAAARLMGDVFQSGVAASLLQRAAELVAYLVMGLVFAYPVWKRWNKKEGDDPHDQA